jgi:hypothetical protein
MRRQLWLAAGVALSLASPVGAQLPGIDAPTGAGVGSSAQRGAGRSAGEQPATPSEIAPRDGNAANRDPASIDNSGKAGARANVGVTGSTESKIDGSAPVDSGIGRSGAGAASGAMKGGAAGSGEGVQPR